MHVIISGPTSARTGGEIRLSLSHFGENMTTPSMQLRREAMESELIQESTQAFDDGALLHLGKQPKLLSRKQCLEQLQLSASRYFATVSNAGRTMQQRVCDTIRRDDGRGTACTS